VTIKNESPVEMVLNSTCESSCFLVTNYSIKFWCFYFLQFHQQQVSSFRRLIRPLSCLLAPSLGLFTFCTLQHYLHNHTAKDTTPLFLSILPSTTKGHLDLLYHRDHHSKVLQVLADLARHKTDSSSSSFQPPRNTVMVPPGSPDNSSHMSSLSPSLQSNLENLSQDAFLQGLIEAPNWS